MKAFDATVVVPTNFVLFTISAILSGMYLSYSTILLFDYSIIQLFNYSIIQLFNYSIIQLCNYSAIQLFNNSSIQLFNYSTIQLAQFNNILFLLHVISSIRNLSIRNIGLKLGKN